MPKSLRHRSILFFLLLVLTPVTQMGAQEFRIETDIYVDRNSKPISENLTLFKNSLVFDFQLAKKSETPIEVIVYDFDKKTFVLMDPSRKVKYEIDQTKLQHFIKSMREDTEFRKRMPFLFDPEFETKHDAQNAKLTLQSESLRYECTYEAISDDNAKKRYFEFVDQYSLLNVTDPKKLPPFARLELNKAIKKYASMPKSVEMELKLPGKGNTRTIHAKSKHFVIWKLSKTDQARIEMAQKMISDYKTVGIEEYRQLNRVRTSSRNGN